MSLQRNPQPEGSRHAWLAVALLAASVSTTRAYTVPDLYEATVPASERAAGDGAAFAAAMATVLVKVTGIDHAPDTLRSALRNARSYVQRYGVGAQGQLEVGFDPAAIDRLITDAGLPIWGRERPTTLVFAQVESPSGGRTWLTAASADPAREAIDEAGDQRGVPLVWPMLDSREQSLVRSLDRLRPSAEGLAPLATRYGADAVLLGTLTSNAEGQVSGSWTLVFGDELGDRTGGPEAAMALAAEQFVSAFGATASDVTQLDVTVSGIVDLTAYARTLEYLERLSVTESVSVEEVAGETIRLRLALRGSPATFARSVALDDRLVPIETPAVADRPTYRYQP